MRTITRKVYMSLLTMIIVIFTMFTTTYAWVGMLTYSTLGGVDLNLKTVKNEMPYHLMISSDGVNFKDSVSAVEIQKQILMNMGYNYQELLNQYSSDSNINTLFTRIARLTPVTTKVNSDNTIDKFYSMDELVKGNTDLFESNKYYKFDLYFAVEANEGNQSTTSINSSIVFADIENLITGVDCYGTLINSDPFKNLPSTNPYYSILSNIPNSFSIDSSYATRAAFSVYQPIKIGDNYSTEKPLKTVIYQGGTQEPSIIDGKYSLGGILPEEENLAIREINELYKVHANTNNVPVSRLNDLELKDENKVLWNKPTTVDTNNLNYLGVENQIQTKIKVSVYFWFEGWDADCTRFIDTKVASLNLAFSTDIRDKNS